MKANHYVCIGKFLGTHGLRGELVLQHALGKKTALKGLSAIFVADKTGNYLPWFVEGAKAKTDEEILVKLEGLDTPEDARMLVRKQAWIAAAELEKYAAGSSAISLLGFTVVEGNEALGVVKEVIEQPHQVLCRIEINGKEAYIPLHGETLLETDQKNRKIYVSLPQGLLDIYLA